MADFTIEIDCNSKPWFDDAQAELQHVWSQLKPELLLSMWCGERKPLLDSQGNKTGSIKTAPLA